MKVINTTIYGAWIIKVITQNDCFDISFYGRIVVHRALCDEDFVGVLCLQRHWC